MEVAEAAGRAEKAIRHSKKLPIQAAKATTTIPGNNTDLAVGEDFDVQTTATQSITGKSFLMSNPKISFIREEHKAPTTANEDLDRSIDARKELIELYQSIENAEKVSEHRNLLIEQLEVKAATSYSDFKTKRN